MTGEQREIEAVSLPPGGCDFTPGFAESPVPPRSGDGSPVSLEADDRALDEFVAGCLARLRQVMDELQ